LIRAFEDENQAYNSLNLSMWANRYGTTTISPASRKWSGGRRMGLEEW
jgi:ATP-dependent helicase/nuclease subunit B